MVCSWGNYNLTQRNWAIGSYGSFCLMRGNNRSNKTCLSSEDIFSYIDNTLQIDYREFGEENGEKQINKYQKRYNELLRYDMVALNGSISVTPTNRKPNVHNVRFFSCFFLHTWLYVIRRCTAIHDCMCAKMRIKQAKKSSSLTVWEICVSSLSAFMHSHCLRFRCAGP